jgi:hypothetical protein
VEKGIYLNLDDYFKRQGMADAFAEEVIEGIDSPEE